MSEDSEVTVDELEEALDAAITAYEVDFAPKPLQRAAMNVLEYLRSQKADGAVTFTIEGGAVANIVEFNQNIIQEIEEVAEEALQTALEEAISEASAEVESETAATVGSFSPDNVV